MCVSLGGFMRYHLTPGFGIIVKPEFIWATQVYEISATEAYIYSNASRNITYAPLTFTFTQPMALFNISAGVAYEF